MLDLDRFVGGWFTNANHLAIHGRLVRNVENGMESFIA